MNHDDTTVFIGASPYGLSVAAYLKAVNKPTIVFGKPNGVLAECALRSMFKVDVEPSSLSDPAAAYTLNLYSDQSVAS